MDGIEIRFESHIPEVTAKIAEVAKERMFEAVQEVRDTTLETLSGQRTGRTYFVPGTHRTYTASSPGEPPAQATAQLRQSVKFTIEGEGTKLLGMVGTDLKKGPMLEYGTRNILPRPWLRVSFEKSQEKVKSIFSRKWF